MHRDSIFRFWPSRRSSATSRPRSKRTGLFATIRRPEYLEDRRLLAFSAPVNIPVSGFPDIYASQPLALGDFYGDGKLDMAVAEGGVNGAPSQIDVLRGNGDGTFQAPVVAYTLGNDDFVNTLATADLNHDGKLDLVALVNNDKVDVLFGNGNGTFQPVIAYEVAPATSSGFGVTSMALGDVNGDGQTDVVVGGTEANDDYTLEVLLGNPDGTLQSPVTSTFGTYTTPQNYLFQPNYLALGDFTGNGKLDVVTGSYCDQRVLVSLGNGDGTFEAPVSYTTDPIPRQAMQEPILGLGVSSISVGDFANNGKVDIAVTNSAAKTVSVLLGNGDGTFQTPVNYSLSFQPDGMVAADFNGDGKLDFAVSDRTGNSIYVLDGNGDGTFQSPVNVATISGPMSMAAGDFNNDGRSDLAVTSVVYGSGGWPTSYAVSIIMSEADPPQKDSAVTAEASFLTNVYQELLRRPIEEAAVAYWTNFLQQGGSRAELVLAIEASAEYRQDEVSALFEQYLHRPAESTALNMGGQLLAGGGTLEQLAVIIVSSDEYFAMHGGTNDGFLNALFQDALNRPIDAASVSAFEQELAAGATRLQIAQIVFSSHEYRADLVQDVYTQLLGRSADPQGSAYWSGLLDNGLTDEELATAIAASDEYFGKRT